MSARIHEFYYKNFWSWSCWSDPESSFSAVIPNLDLQISRSRIMTGGDVSLNGVEYGGLCDENKNYDISKHSSTDFNEHSLMVVS